MKKLTILSFNLLSFLLSGCALNASNVTDYRLCYSQATFPSYNIYHKARAAEINKRGLNCRKYADRIDEEYSKIKLEEAASTKIQNNSTYQYQPPQKNKSVICSVVGNQVICT